MIIIDLDERKFYQNEEPANFGKTKFIEMCKEYFKQFYQDETIIKLIKEMQDEILYTVQGDKVFLVVKNETMYCINDTYPIKICKFEENLYGIKDTAHKVFQECFEDCFPRFKRLGYKQWNEKDIKSIPTIDVDIGSHKDFEKYINEFKEIIKDILLTTLKGDLCDKVCSEIVEAYKSNILENNPILVLVKKCENAKEIYSKGIYVITEKLEVKKVSYFVLEGELEQIIGKVMPKDKALLVNPIYNYIQVFSRKVKPIIRVNKLYPEGVSAILSFYNENQTPIVIKYGAGCCYALLPYHRNWSVNPFNINIEEDKEYDETLIFNEMKAIDKGRFKDVECYVMSQTKKYENTKIEMPEVLENNVLYKLEKEELKVIPDTPDDRFTARNNIFSKREIYMLCKLNIKGIGI